MWEVTFQVASLSNECPNGLNISYCDTEFARAFEENLQHKYGTSTDIYI